MSYEIEINYKWCKKCGLCAKYCPGSVYEQDPFGKPTAVNKDKCVGCMQCVYRCPDFAIEVTKK